MAVLSWNLLVHLPGGYANGMWLMQDGSVLANLYNSTQLVALRPDKGGSYANGSWYPKGNFLLEKWSFASAVLSDGRLVTCGGEYSGPGLPQTETNFCEIYDPQTQSSTLLSPPSGWPSIGDSPSVVLNDGTFLLGNTQGRGDQVALLNPSTLTWTFGGGDADNEQGYTLLQTGDVLTTGVYNATSMRYNSGVNAFVQEMQPLPVMLGAGSETGPGITLMDFGSAPAAIRASTHREPLDKTAPGFKDRICGRCPTETNWSRMTSPRFWSPTARSSWRRRDQTLQRSSSNTIRFSTVSLSSPARRMGATGNTAGCCFYPMAVGSSPSRQGTGMKLSLAGLILCTWWAGRPRLRRSRQRLSPIRR